MQLQEIAILRGQSRCSDFAADQENPDEHHGGACYARNDGIRGSDLLDQSSHVDDSIAAWCRAHCARAAHILKPTQTARYPSPNVSTNTGIPRPWRPAAVAAKRSRTGVAAAVIIPTIMTAHIRNAVTTRNRRDRCQVRHFATRTAHTGRYWSPSRRPTTDRARGRSFLTHGPARRDWRPDVRCCRGEAARSPEG